MEIGANYGFFSILKAQGLPTVGEPVKIAFQQKITYVNEMLRFLKSLRCSEDRQDRLLIMYS